MAPGGRYGLRVLLMRFLRLLALGGTLAACSRSALDGGRGQPGSDAGPDACVTVKVGDVARTPAIQQATFGGGAIDSDDDLLLLVAGLSGNGVWAESISAIRLGSGEPLAMTRAGDSRVTLGPSTRVTWDSTYHRAIVLGGGRGLVDPNADDRQVFAMRIEGTSAVLSLLPDFPGGTTSDVPLAAAVDSVMSRLIVIPEKGGQAGPVQTWALSLAPGGEQWSLLAADGALQSVQMLSLSYDPARNRMLAFGGGAMWALSLESPSLGWTQIPGTLPPALMDYATGPLGAGLALAWDDQVCAFVTAVTDGSCNYEVWRLDVGDTFTASPLGIAAQPETRYGRGVGAFDARRGNFVFGSAFDCELGHDYVAASSDFLPVLP